MTAVALIGGLTLLAPQLDQSTASAGKSETVTIEHYDKDNNLIKTHEIKQSHSKLVNGLNVME